ncbi:hypothetical protein JX266_013978 [Neoarthrinium moseri]|nr:hypothetical protein JX266_013978 [Neoarthrinium moseri]
MAVEQYNTPVADTSVADTSVADTPLSCQYINRRSTSPASSTFGHRPGSVNVDNDGTSSIYYFAIPSSK